MLRFTKDTSLVTAVVPGWLDEAWNNSTARTETVALKKKNRNIKSSYDLLQIHGHT